MKIFEFTSSALIRAISRVVWDQSYRCVTETVHGTIINHIDETVFVIVMNQVNTPGLIAVRNHAQEYLSES